MKTLWMMAVLVALPLSAKAEVTRYQANGVSGSGGACTSAGCNTVNVDELDDGSAYVQYSFVDPSTGHLLAGFGTVPAGAVKNDGTNRLQLAFDTRQAPGFRTEECVPTSPYGGYNCADSPGGQVSFEWTTNGFSSTRETSNYRAASADIVRHESGVLDDVSADLTGSIYGMAFPSSSNAHIRVSHGVDVEIDRG